MKDDLRGGVVVVGKTIDNSQVVRQVDPRSSRDLWSLLVLVTALVGALGLYAWPHLELRQIGIATELMNRERERLVEENRKLRLEKAMLENLRRVEAIAARDLGMAPPPPERLIVIEKPEAVPEAARLASGKDIAAGGAKSP
jgi:cell division protein FtsL